MCELVEAVFEKLSASEWAGHEGERWSDAKEGDAVADEVATECLPWQRAFVVDAVGDGKDDVSAGLVGDGLCNGADIVPEPA